MAGINRLIAHPLHPRDRGITREFSLMPPPLSIAITAFNEEANLARCLQSVVDIAEEIVVVDSGSTDRTKEIARGFGVRVVHQDWLGHSGQKQVAIGHCTKEWVLVLDCDEELSPVLRESVLDFFNSGKSKQFDGAYHFSC